MLERSQNVYPLLQQFREFYEVVALQRGMAESASEGDDRGQLFVNGRRQASTGSPAPSADPMSEREVSPVAIEDGVDATTQAVWREMARYLDQKMYEVHRASTSLTHDFLEELVYLMAAFADETFACLVEWHGREYWSENWMESRLFRSQVAGERIFRNIDRILTRQDYGSDELSAIYLMALALGFRGQYLRDPSTVESYRQRLFERLLMTNPDLRRSSLRLFPESYRHTVSEGASVNLPEPRRWWLVVVGVVATWLTLSTAAWLYLTYPTAQALHITMRALETVRERQTAVESSIKWRTLDVTLQSNGVYRLILPQSLPLVAVGGKASALAPLVVAVNGQGGNSAGTASDVQDWLTRGSITFQTDVQSAVPAHRALASVELMQSHPTAITVGGSTLFFSVDTGISAQELYFHPQLVLPEIRKGTSDPNISVGSVVLYVPARPTGVTP